jgi:2-hydroxychromene-2-carboxylate isomerase
MPGPIDFYFDFISPYGYLGATQIDAIASRHGREVRWRPFLLGVTVMQVMGLKPLMETPLKADYVMLDKQRMASLLGVPLATPDMSGASSVAAARAFYWAHDRDPAQAVALARRLLQRLWVEARPIAAAEAVAEEAADVGIEPAALLAALREPAVKERLRERWTPASRAASSGRRSSSSTSSRSGASTACGCWSTGSSTATGGRWRGLGGAAAWPSAEAQPLPERHRPGLVEHRRAQGDVRQRQAPMPEEIGLFLALAAGLRPATIWPSSACRFCSEKRPLSTCARRAPKGPERAWPQSSMTILSMMSVSDSSTRSSFRRGSRRRPS